MRIHASRGAALLVAGWAGWAGWLAAACSGDAPREPGREDAAESAPSGQPESTRRMAALLVRLAGGEDAGEDAFGSDEGAGAGSLRDEEGVYGRYVEVRALLRAGRTAEAIAGFEELVGLLEQRSELVSPEGHARIRRDRGVAYLRLAEVENCLEEHNRDSCLMPIEAGGVHRHQKGGRAAMAAFAAELAERPDDLVTRWLLNLAAMTVGEYPDGVAPELRIPPEVFASEEPFARHFDVAPEAGVDVLGLSGGCITEDFDEDGDLDILASSWSIRDQLRYFANQGDGTFAERTEAAGLAGITGGLNLLQADYDGDGWTDAFLPRGAWRKVRGRLPNSLLRNEGGGRFRDVTEEAGLLDFHPTQTAAFADYDGDGDLDLYVGNESFQDDVHPCQLFQNDGAGRFVDVAAAAGVNVRAYVKGVTWGDVDDDGRPDLYVSDLLGPNLLFANRGPHPERAWAFEERGGAAGVRLPANGFPVWFWDYDNDGREDLFAAAYPVGIFRGQNDVPADYLGLPHAAEPPRLYRNAGGGRFEDVTVAVGFDRVLYTMGCNFGDVDGDGFLDAYLGTGAPSFDSLMPNRMFRNDGGRRFQDVTTAGGFGHLQKGHAIAFGDLDNDGDEDVYAVMGGAYTGDAYPNALFANPGHGARWIALDLEGRRANRSAIGARIELGVEGPGGERAIHRTVSSGGSFGASSLRQEIGLGEARRIRHLRVRWPGSGTVQTFEDVALDRSYRLVEGQGLEVLDVDRFALPDPGRPAAGGHAHHRR
jgi:hypothetical protein